MSIFEGIVNGFNEHIDASAKSIELLTPYIAEATHLFIETLLEDKKIFCGTSGNTHSIGSQFCHNLLISENLARPSLPVILLGGSNSHLLAMIDRTSTEKIFAQEIQSIAQPDDLLFLISSSGSEKNLLNSIDVALEKGMRIITLSGGANKEISTKISSSDVNIPAWGISHQQTLSVQYVIVQILSDLIEKQIFGESPQ